MPSGRVAAAWTAESIDDYGGVPYDMAVKMVLSEDEALEPNMPRYGC